MAGEGGARLLKSFPRAMGWRERPRGASAGETANMRGRSSVSSSMGCVSLRPVIQSLCAQNSFLLWATLKIKDMMCVKLNAPHCVGT